MKQPWIKELFNISISDLKAILVRNLPIDKNIPPSPVDTGYLDPKHYPLIRDIILTFHKIMNLIPYAYKDENKGRLFRSLVPVKKEEDMVGSHGSKYAFGYHVDNPTYSIYPEYKRNSLNAPEYLSLFCIRGREDVKTNLILLDDILKKLDTNSIKILQQPFFKINTPDSFKENYHEVENKRILAKYNNQYYTRFDYHNVEGINKEGIMALKKFIDVMEQVSFFSIALKKGDFLVFKNQQTLHSRNAFKANYNSEDRWLLRVYSSISLEFLNNINIIKGLEGCI